MPRVLVVDDEPDTLQLLYLTLRRAGYQVTTASSADAALAFLSQDRFDVVVLDLMMPGKSGFEVLHALRLHREPPPVVVLSAKSGLQDRAEALSLGAAAYLVKPTMPQELLDTLSRVLQERKGDHGYRSL